MKHSHTMGDRFRALIAYDPLAGLHHKKRRQDGGRVNLASHIREQAKSVDISPTDGQKEAGNYRKGHVNIHGLDISIENPRGSWREGGPPDKRWRSRLPNHYGYFRGTEGNDGDHVDCYIGPHLKAPNVFVIDQHGLNGGKPFDEHKVMLGFGSKVQAREAYNRAFSDGRGKERIGHIETMTVDELKDWLKNSDTTKPVKAGRKGYADGGNVSNLSDADQAAMSPETFANPLVKNTISGLATLPKRALDASAQDVQHLGEEGYQPQSVGPAVETALNTMSGGTFASHGVDATLGIVPVDVARKLNFKTKLPEGDTFRRAIENTPGATVDQDAMTIPLKRQQNPDQEMAESVRGGVFYQPGGPGGFSYTGRNNYGGSQLVQGETAFKNPLFVKGATGGKAPESAFDHLNGKGAYEAMRDDALKSIQRSTWGSRGIDEAKVYSFLEKHAPEMADYSGYIIQNSKQGNQLAYALQEAAVASAARRAGHDGIVGYSTKRNATKDPFISEVYDVRENRYPSPSGDYSVWDNLRPKADGGRVHMADGGAPAFNDTQPVDSGPPPFEATQPVEAPSTQSMVPEPADHGLSDRQKLSPLEKAVSPITSYPETYQRMMHESLDQASKGVQQILHPDGAMDVVKGIGNAAAGSVGYVASPISSAYRSVIGQPVEDVTGIPREYTEFAAQLATPGIGMTGSLPKTPVMTVAKDVPPPTTKELFKAAENNYANMHGYGVEIHPHVVSNVADGILDELHTQGYRDYLAPKTFRAVEELKNPVGANSTTQDIEGVRRALNKAGSDPAERDAARRAIAAIDHSMSSMAPSDVAVNPHFADRVAKEAAEARGNYAAAKRSEMLDEIGKKASRQANAAGSGTGIDNATRQRIKSVLDNPKKLRGFSDSEKEQMEQIVKGTFTGNAARLLGKFSPSGIVSGALSAGAGFAAHGPLGAVVLPAAGYAAKKLGDMSTLSQAAKLSRMVRSRAPLSRNKAPMPVVVPPSTVPRLAAPAGLGAANLQTPYTGMNLGPLQGTMPARADDKQP